MTKMSFFLQTSLLCIVEEFVGRGFVACAIGVLLVLMLLFAHKYRFSGLLYELFFFSFNQILGC